MPPKKGKGKKGKKGKKGGALGADPDDFKSFNVDQRQILIALFEKMRINKEANTKIRREVIETKADLAHLKDDNVSTNFSLFYNNL